MESKPPLIVITNADMNFLEMIAEVLGDEGYGTLIVKEGQQAFELIKQNQPALVILEMLLSDPERGLMVLNKLRLDQQTATIPVIIASTSTDLIQRNEAHFRAKHCDILMKPFDLEELLAMVGKYVQPPA